MLAALVSASVSSAAEPGSLSDERPSSRKLVFSQPLLSADEAVKKQTREQSTRLFGLLGAMDEFQCRVSKECFVQPSLGAIGSDAAFQDVILGVPVYGQARVDAQAALTLVPDEDQLTFDLTVVGTVALKGTGRSQDIQIRTDTLVDFTATKRIQMNHEGLIAGPTECDAKAAITTKGINSVRPKFLGKFSEKIAQRRSATSKDEAEAECAEHVADAVIERLDEEVNGFLTIVNTSLAEHMEKSAPDAQARWAEIRFVTDDDWAHIGRAAAGKELPEFTAMSNGRTVSPIVLQLPRARLDANVVLTGLRCLQKDSAQPAASSHVADRQPVKFRPVVELGQDTIIIRLEFDHPAPKLAQDQPVVAASSMP